MLFCNFKYSADAVTCRQQDKDMTITVQNDVEVREGRAEYSAEVNVEE